jgi:hypothetical protein
LPPTKAPRCFSTTAAITATTAATTTLATTAAATTTIITAYNYCDSLTAAILSPFALFICCPLPPLSVFYLRMSLQIFKYDHSLVSFVSLLQLDFFKEFSIFKAFKGFNDLQGVYSFKDLLGVQASKGFKELKEFGRLQSSRHS